MVGGAPQGPPTPPPKDPAPHPAPEGHLAGESDEGGLDLRVVGVLKEVVGLEDVVGLHPIARDGPQEVPDVLQLCTGQLGAWTPCPALGTLAPCSPPSPDPPIQGPLTLCQFWMGSFTFCTEPGCSLLMSLGGERAGARARVRAGVKVRVGAAISPHWSGSAQVRSLGGKGWGQA